ncbi:MAG: penicillin acylase family protein [Vicinamibacterales bacterium]
MRIRKAATNWCIAISVGVVVATAWTPAATHSQASSAHELPGQMLQVPGLDQPVEILRDRWGVAHIYAKTEHDLFFAQGYNAVRDRLFQFELWRRQATGTVAEILGKRELKRDIGARLHRFRGNLSDELNFYHPRGEVIITAFVQGVNAYIDEAVERPDALPVEFKMLGIVPKRWTPDVVISRHNALLANVRQELNMGRAVRALGEEKVRDLSTFYGGEPEIRLDPALDAAALDADILELYNAFREPLRFTSADLAPAYRRQAAVEQLQRRAAPTPVDLSQQQEDIGSNNWVVSGRLTQSGKPLLANDPHRVQAAPSLRYLVHLVGPGWNAIGAGEPVLPGISIGHNEWGAWGLTIFGTDTEDLYVYETNPADPGQYRYQDRWEGMRVVRETIQVKGEEPATVELKYTRHGPVLLEDRARQRAYGLRAAWMELGAAPYLASLRMNQARNWDEFREACTFSRLPAENMVWADREGNIGWQAVAITPVRRNWSGLVPVPGDGRYEWEGYLPIAALPSRYNPADGFVVTANNYLFPDGYQHREAQHWTGADPYRASRVTELLSSRRPHTLSGMIRMQNDDLSLPARALVPMLRHARVTSSAGRMALEAVLDWDYVLDKESVPAGVYEMFQRRLLEGIRNLVVPEAARGLVGGISMSKAIGWLEAPDGRFGEDPIRGRDELLGTAFERAVEELTKRFGPDMTRWRYGQTGFHHALIRHPLSDAVSADLRARLDVGPVPRGGDSYTVTATGGGDNQVSGGSLKFIADLSDWDLAVAINNPGQSGNPDSSHYRDLFELWASGRYFPLLYTRAKVESVAAERVTLQSSKTTARARTP